MDRLFRTRSVVNIWEGSGSLVGVQVNDICEAIDRSSFHPIEWQHATVAEQNGDSLPGRSGNTYANWVSTYPRARFDHGFLLLSAACVPSPRIQTVADVPIYWEIDTTQGQSAVNTPFSNLPVLSWPSGPFERQVQPTDSVLDLTENPASASTWSWEKCYMALRTEFKCKNVTVTEMQFWPAHGVVTVVLHDAQDWYMPQRRRALPTGIKPRVLGCQRGCVVAYGIVEQLPDEASEQPMPVQYMLEKDMNRPAWWDGGTGTKPGPSTTIRRDENSGGWGRNLAEATYVACRARGVPGNHTVAPIGVLFADREGLLMGSAPVAAHGVLFEHDPQPSERRTAIAGTTLFTSLGRLTEQPGSTFASAHHRRHGDFRNLPVPPLHERQSAPAQRLILSCPNSNSPLINEEVTIQLETVLEVRFNFESGPGSPPRSTRCLAPAWWCYMGQGMRRHALAWDKMVGCAVWDAKSNKFAGLLLYAASRGRWADWCLVLNAQWIMEPLEEDSYITTLEAYLRGVGL